MSLDQPTRFITSDSSVLLRDLPMSLDRRHLPVWSALGRMGIVSLDFAPISYLPAAQEHKATVSRTDDTDTSVDAVISPVSRVYMSGEVGVLYGKSFGKYGGDEFQSYIFGTVGNEHFSVTAGASFEESSVRYPRRRR